MTAIQAQALPGQIVELIPSGGGILAQVVFPDGTIQSFATDGTLANLTAQVQAQMTPVKPVSDLSVGLVVALVAQAQPVGP